VHCAETARCARQGAPWWTLLRTPAGAMTSSSESAKRSKITVALAADLVAAHFPHWAELPLEAIEPGGWDNMTFRLGDAMSVRLPSAEAYASQVEKEQRWLPRLAPSLPLPIPVPLARGLPSAAYPWPWSVYAWLEGETAASEPPASQRELAKALAEFLVALQRVDPTHGPAPGPHNFYRGGPLTTYDSETRCAIRSLGGEVDARAVSAVWEAGLAAIWSGPPVWIHGDLSPTNVLVDQGRLCAVIDFGCCGVGDPACDLVMAWTFFSGEGREAFRAALPLEGGTWARARAWALWKALITLAEHKTSDPSLATRARRTLGEVLADHAHATRS
jgi:aminoglycoside phosphotransferase (APT) family kinase protein